MTHEIIFIDEVAKRLRLSIASVNRLLARRRRGEDELFPLPLASAPKSKGRWLASAVDDYIEMLASVNAAKAAPVPITAAQQRRDRKAYEQRQAAAEVALQRHRINSKAKGAQGS